MPVVIHFQRFLFLLAGCLILAMVANCGNFKDKPNQAEIVTVTMLDSLGEQAQMLWRQNILGDVDNERIQLGIDYALKLRRNTVPFVPTDLCKNAEDRLTCVNEIARTTREKLESVQ